MSEETFQYIVRPGSGGKLTTQPRYRGLRTEADLLPLLAAQTGKPAAEIEAIIRALAGLIIDQTVSGWKVELFELLGFQLGTGGSDPGPDFPANFDAMNAALSGYFSTAGRERARAAFSPEKVGEQGRVVPVIVSVTDTSNEARDHYTPGRALRLELENKRGGKFDKANPAHRIRLKAANGTVTEITDYPFVQQSTIVGTVPAGLTGPQELSLSMDIYGEVRTGMYPFALQP